MTPAFLVTSVLISFARLCAQGVVRRLVRR